MGDGKGAGQDGLGAFQLTPSLSERVWGRRDLRPWMDRSGLIEAVGEAWLTGPKAVVTDGPLAGQAFDGVVREHAEALLGDAGGSGSVAEFPLLIKLLFPSDKLSVQVHPNDLQAQALGQPRGKTECWYVLEAEPGAAVALGLKPGATRARVEQAVTDETLESLLEMVPVRVGDMVFVDAGTVHAIGPGVVLLETQQTSDITYRMYDYGRPRELHLQQGLDVMLAETRAGQVAPQQRDGFTRLIEAQYFVVDRYDLAAGASATVAAVMPGCVVGLSGHGRVERADEPGVAVERSAATVLPVGADVQIVAGEAGLSFTHCWAPAGV